MNGKEDDDWNDGENRMGYGPCLDHRYRLGLWCGPVGGSVNEGWAGEHDGGREWSTVCV